MFEWVAQHGAIGIIIFLGAYILASVFLIPGLLLTLGAGAAFGFIKGIPIASAGATLGATAAFLVSRHLTRGLIRQRIEQIPLFDAIDKAVCREGWKIVGLARLSPILPFTLLNYAFGLTRVKLGEYVIASWVGMLPGTILYIYLGTVLRNVTEFQNRRRSPIEWTFLIIGLAATLWILMRVTRAAREVLGEKLKPQNSND